MRKPVATRAYGINLDTLGNTVNRVVTRNFHQSSGHILSLCNDSYLKIETGISLNDGMLPPSALRRRG
ncbi:hypothetical protein BGZ91_005367 [Linnemannia elongata]|nr:hypothetical protein BGZ91_005367 [Linnemannia elongata]